MIIFIIEKVSIYLYNIEIYLISILIGPQIAWKTVFLIEYAGPLIIHPIFYWLPGLIYGKLATTIEHRSLAQS